MATPKQSRTIKNDPFADLIPDPEVTKIRVKAETKTETVIPTNGSLSRPQTKTKITIRIDSALAERIKNAVYWNPELTVAGLAVEGIRRTINEIEKKNQGPYPPRTSQLKPGRPLK